MNNDNYITNEALPLTQNFRLLKQNGLEYVQKHVGSEWTNLNPSDPGITILDQVCYALTELGYCNDFPVEDLLARQDGSIAMHNRFYMPGEILTTAPVTINDYRKYLIDGVDGVTNAILLPATDAVTNSFIYKVYLQLDSSLYDNPDAINIACEAAFYYLNKSRNIGELFGKPEWLQPVRYIIRGSIEINDSEKVYELLKDLNDAICNYIFPVVSQSSNLLLANGDIDELYNGPLLQHGAISNECLGQKRDTIYAVDIVLLAENIPGVIQADLSFLPVKPGSVSVGPSQLLAIDLHRSIQNGLQVKWNGNPITVSASKLKQVLNGAAKNVVDDHFNINAVEEPALPKGHFRDIASYYSIQNTFPEIFAAGADSVTANASQYQIAQSRQLKGYLTLFDQVLANQFAQLASVGRLFSFKNTEEATSAGDKGYRLPDAGMERPEKVYPARYRSFLPTYFFQPLYDVPHIRPLLKGNEIFDFGNVEESAKEQAHKSWIAYQNDPYNAYVRGLMNCMEDEGTSLERRNNILDHLLARHGEAPLLIDTFAEALAYTGNRLQGLIIIKSLYLQNLGLLSYNRQKAYNYIGANKLDPALPEIPVNVEQKMLYGNRTDFIFDTKAADREEKLHPHHLIQYAAIELKLNLLFALRVQYENFIVTNHADPEKEQEVRVAYWMIRQRRGIILVEETLLRFPSVAKGQNDPGFIERHPFLNNRVHIILPDFLLPGHPASDQSLKDRLHLFLEQELPVQVPFRCHFVSSRTLSAIIIPVFCKWHNSLIYTNESQTDQHDVKPHATDLIDILSKINSSPHA